MRILILLLVLLVGLIVAAVFYAFSYNVAATQPDTGIVRFFINTITEASIKREAGAIVEIPDLNSPERIRSGFRFFDTSCRLCHGAPAALAEPFADGLYPLPPPLQSVLDEWKPSEFFWIAKHGIKLTGMPAFAQSRHDDEIWSVVAFIHQLPRMTRDDYLDLRRETTPQYNF